MGNYCSLNRQKAGHRQQVQTRSQCDSRSPIPIQGLGEEENASRSLDSNMLTCICTLPAEFNPMVRSADRAGIWSSVMQGIAFDGGWRQIILPVFNAAIQAFLLGR